MQAYQLTKYQRHSLALALTEIPRPTPSAQEVLIQVKASGVNPLDNLITRGEVRLVTPYDLPLTMGNECAGVVVEVGAEVTSLSVGDRVFTRLPIAQPGAFAEYVTTPASAVAKLPDMLSFIEGASIPLTALTAYQALELMQAKAGQRIFISGGSGGLGAMAIPLAKARGLQVCTSGNEASRQRLLDLGADRYLNYRTEDYLQELEPVDFVLDSLGGKELERQMKLVKPGGVLVSLRGMPNGSFAKRFGLPKWKQLLLSLAGWSTDRQARAQGIRYEFLFVQADGAQLASIAQLIQTQGIRPSIGQVYPFPQANEALAQLAQGGVSGKIILTHD